MAAPFRFQGLPLWASVALAASALAAQAADQTVPGAGNARAVEIAAPSPRVQEAHEFLLRQARAIKNRALREATRDRLQIRSFCVTSRGGVDAAMKSTLRDALEASGFVNRAEGDFAFSIPAADDAAVLIATLAPNCGYSPTDANDSTAFRNPVFAQISQERIPIRYGNGGLSAVRAELDALRARQGL